MGCISEVRFDHVTLDLNNFLQDRGSTPGCPALNAGGCAPDTCTSVDNGVCSMTLDGPMCDCFSKNVGKNCEKSKLCSGDFTRLPYGN